MDEIRSAADELRILLRPRNPTEEQVGRLEFIKKTYGRMPAIAKMFSDDYDRKAVHSGYGAPDCYCHLAPPCENCINWCVDCKVKTVNGKCPNPKCNAPAT